MRIYSLKDRITVKIDELEFKLAPLSYKQKIEIQSLLTSGKEFDGIARAIKYSVRHVSGLEDVNGEEYKIKLEADVLSDESLDDLMNLEISMKLHLVCAHLVSGIPSKIIHPDTGEEIEGVEIVGQEIKKKRKR